MLTGFQTEDCYMDSGPCTLAQRGSARRSAGSLRLARLHTVLSVAAPEARKPPAATAAIFQSAVSSD